MPKSKEENWDLEHPRKNTQNPCEPKAEEELAVSLADTPQPSPVQFGRETCVTLAVCDTLLLPAKDNDATYRSLLLSQEWRPVRVSQKKLPHLRYLAFCFGPPTRGVTHYAVIDGWRLSGDGKLSFRHLPPVQLDSPVCRWRDGERGLNTPRYTTLSLLLDTPRLMDLFA